MSLKQALLPPPHYGTCLHFCREKSTALSSLVDSRRIVLTHATMKRSRQLVVSFEKKSPVLAPGFELVTPNLVVFKDIARPI